MSITEISRKIGINRNSVAKYLDVLLISGEVEVKKVCTAKLYFLSERVPLSEMLSLTSDGIIVLNSSGVIDFANVRFLKIEGCQLDEIVGKKLSDVSFTLIDDELMEKVFSSSPGEISEKEIHVEMVDESQTFRTKCIGTVLPDGCSATTLIFEDITKKRECQERLRIKEALYRAVVEDQSEFIIRYRPDRTITFVNDAYCRAFGIDRQEVIGRVFAPSIPANYREKVSAQLLSLTPENPVVSFANPVVMPDGNEGWHQWTNRGIFRDSGTLIGYQSVGWDITEQMRVQKVKYALLEEFTILSDFSGGLMMLSEDDDIWSYCAETLAKVSPSSLMLLFSYRDGLYHFHEAVSGKKWGDNDVVNTLNIAKGMQFPCLIDSAREMSSMDLQPFSEEWAGYFGEAFGNSGGGIFDAKIRSYGIRSMGIMTGNDLLGVCLVVSENGNEPRSDSLIETILNQAAVMIQNRYMLNSMRLTEKRYESLLNHSASMIGIHVGGNILYANPRLRELLGISPSEDLDYLPFTDFIHPDDLEFVTQRMIQVYSEGKAAPPRKERLLDTNGNVKEVMVFSLPTVYHGKLGSQFIVQPLS
ncbi:PAS domain S-box protein [Methanogenium marinum]|uniref:histidine kinase n=1 Tax=Methanogenium marinum TaxID=348610 RepID=A0A9Q4KP57_9EURY|nr:PAS domain S-box protein [Methanogenium marinum]MDE4907640.1 PAS domain S-box protein [Methanogenium marinum]